MVETNWVSDSRGNQCSAEYFGSEEAARKALDSLEDCNNCENCSDCSRCSRCSDCSGCSDCSDCSGCSRCSGCSDCSDCSGCSRCSRCSGLKNAAPVETGEKPIIPIVPVVKDLHRKIYEGASHPGALAMDSWHTCEKTHCRAGWVIALAGPAGRELEKFFDTPLAAMKIYDASCPGYTINPARFFDDNDTALADMKALAEASHG